MNVENKPIHVGDTVFYPHETPTNTLWKPGEVRDVNEHVKAVKVLFFTGNKEKGNAKGKTEWFPAGSLRLSDPKMQQATS